MYLELVVHARAAVDGLDSIKCGLGLIGFEPNWGFVPAIELAQLNYIRPDALAINFRRFKY